MKNQLTTIITAAAVLAGAFAARGTNYYWDNNDGSAGFGSAGGIWGVDSLWGTDFTGTSLPVVVDTAADDDLYFGTDDAGLAAGTITVDGTSQAFKTMTFGAASGGITLSGGTLNLAAPSSAVILNSAADAHTIGSVLAGSNAVQFKFKEELTVTYPSTLPDHSNSVTIVSNRQVADCIAAGGTLGGRGFAERLPVGTAYFFANNGTTATWQLQAVDDVWIKCVKVELTQVGADIRIRTLYGAHIQSVYGIGTDFDTFNFVAPNENQDAYQVMSTTLIFKPSAKLTLTGSSSYAGSTTIKSLILGIDGDGGLGGGAYGGNIALDSGKLLYNSAAHQVLSGNISGGGSLQKSGVEKEPVDIIYSSTLPAHNNSVTIVTNRRLVDCIAAGGKLGGSGAIPGGPYASGGYFFENNGMTATWQLQILDGGWIKCVKAELRQVGPDISIQTLYGAHIQNSYGIGTDFDTFVFTPPNNNQDNYPVAEITLTFKPNSTLTLTGANSYTGGTIIDKGTLVATTSAASLPLTGGIFVNSGGELVLRVPGREHYSSGVGNNNPIYVNGGTLTIDAKFNAGHTRPIIIDGGVLNSTSNENNDNGNYTDNLTLKNGASINGNKIRVGNTAASPTITVSGTSASSIPAGINMVKGNNISLIFNIDDVTGDTDADLTIPGEIRDFGPDHAGLPIIKNGAGTLSLSGDNTRNIAEFRINAGVLALDSQNALTTLNNIVLNSGALQVSAYTNNVGTLTLSSNSSIALGEFGSIAFKESSAITWSGTLNMTGGEASQSIRFGTSAAALTLAQLNAITWNGKNVYLDADGYLCASPSGTVILVQ